VRANISPANAEELVGAAVEAAKKGEWRALMALMDRVYGKPSEHVELIAEAGKAP
jgi:hypothetical protein